MAQLDKSARLDPWLGRGLGGDTNLPTRELQPPLIGSAGPLNQDVTKMPGWKAQVNVFDLGDKEGMEAYRDLLNTVGSSPFSRISYVERHWVEATGNWKVLVEVEHKIRVEIPFER